MMKVLVIDVGGTDVKVRIHGNRADCKLASGPKLTPKEMIEEVLEATKEWKYEAVSVGYHGPVRQNKPAREPVNLGKGWVGFDYAKAMGLPVRMLNDAAMQSVGCYRGGRMLFLGLGTGLGSALVVEKVVVPLELAHLHYRKGRTFEGFLGRATLERLGRKKAQRIGEKCCDIN